MICVVVPAYNEEKLIGGVLDAMPKYVDTVIVVNDGSTDKTVATAKEKGAIVLTRGWSSISYRSNKGTGTKCGHNGEHRRRWTI